MAKNIAALNWEIHRNFVTVTSAELLALYTTPKVLVEAPGAGKALEFIGAFLAYDYGTVAYTVGSAGSYRVRFTSQSTNVSSTATCTDFIDQSEDEVRILKPDSTAIPFVNTSLEFMQPGANPTAGDGVMHVQILYRVWETGL
jgi:hypothetical protein